MDEEMREYVVGLTTETVQLVTSACATVGCTAEQFAAANLVASGLVLTNLAPEGFAEMFANIVGPMAHDIVVAVQEDAERTWG